MKEIKQLERRIHWCECIHLGYMTLLLAFPLILTFQSDDRSTQLLLALGTVIPVQLIRVLCERIRQKPLRLLAGLAVTGLAILLTWSRERWSVYLICCIPILISGVFLPRSKGRILLTVPSPWAVLALLIAYGYGRSVETLGVFLIPDIVLALTALMVVNYFIYTSQVKLLKEIRSNPDTEISVSGMIRQNRKTLMLFLLIGAAILTAIPFLLRLDAPESVPLGTMEQETVHVATNEFNVEREYGRSGEGRPLDLELYKDILTWILILIPSVGVIVSLIHGLRMLLDGIARKKKHVEPKETEGLRIERLDETAFGRKKEKLSGWEKKLRRRYEKLILQRTSETTELRALTPAELERAAELWGPAAQTVHRLYSETRYSPVPADRERYTAFKEAVKKLDPPRERPQRG